MILSATSGRIRIRSPFLKARTLANTAKQCIEDYPGVTEVRSILQTGSIVVRYDTEKVDEQALEAHIERVCTPKKRPKSKQQKTLTKQLNRATKIGMVGSLASSLALGFMGKKKPHIYTGTAFVAFAGLHMAKHYKTLIR